MPLFRHYCDVAFRPFPLASSAEHRRVCSDIRREDARPPPPPPSETLTRTHLVPGAYHADSQHHHIITHFHASENYSHYLATV